MRFSLVIPAYNEAELLPRLLASVDTARQRYTRGAGEIEVIVADNASTDATAEIARAHGCRIARVERRAIAAARNGGAALARGEVLCFVDADMQIHPETLNVVDRAISDPRCVAGATGVRLDRWSVGLACTFALMVPFIVLTGFDTGVVFCRREDFIAVGGYDERRLYAEDVAFLWALKRLGRRRRQRLMRPRGAKALASTRKFDEHGQWHYFTAPLRIALDLAKGSDRRHDFVRRYWYAVRDRHTEDPPR